MVSGVAIDSDDHHSLAFRSTRQNCIPQCETNQVAVMPGHPGPAFGRPECKLVPGIHVLAACQVKTWMAGTSPAMTAVSTPADA